MNGEQPGEEAPERERATRTDDSTDLYLGIPLFFVSTFSRLTARSRKATSYTCRQRKFLKAVGTSVVAARWSFDVRPWIKRSSTRYLFGMRFRWPPRSGG